MKILAIGDFHGKFPEKLKRKISKYKFDIILSVGDFCGNDKWSKLFFKHFYAKGEEEKEKVPKKYHNLLKQEEKIVTDKGIGVLKKLKRFNKPFFAVHGNWDPNPLGNDIVIFEEETPNEKELRKFHKIFKKNFELVDFSFKDFGILYWLVEHLVLILEESIKNLLIKVLKNGN